MLEKKSISFKQQISFQHNHLLDTALNSVVKIMHQATYLLIPSHPRDYMGFKKSKASLTKLTEPWQKQFPRNTVTRVNACPEKRKRKKSVSVPVLCHGTRLLSQKFLQIDIPLKFQGKTDRILKPLFCYVIFKKFILKVWMDCQFGEW